MPAPKKKVAVPKFHADDQVNFEGKKGTILDTVERKKDDDAGTPYFIYTVFFSKKEKKEIREEFLKKA
jgi:hypothetical protein